MKLFWICFAIGFVIGMFHTLLATPFEWQEAHCRAMEAKELWDAALGCWDAVEESK